MTIDLDKLEELLSKATPGRWEADSYGWVEADIDGKKRLVASVASPSFSSIDLSSNAEFIAAAHTALPSLIAAVRFNRAQVRKERGEVRALLEEVERLRKRVAELERDARLGQAVREAAEQTGDITDVEVLRDDDLCRGGYLGTIVVTEYQFDVLRAIDSALREEEGEEAPNA